MITDKGKGIIAKFLIGQAPSYASHIAIGCGPKALSSLDVVPQGEYSNKTNLDFEMFRVPIISRGYIQENGESKIVLTAELPTQDRYEITEVGVYSAAANPSAGAYDSKIIYSFNQDERWEMHGAEGATAIASIPGSLGDLSAPYNIVQTSKAFFANSDNKTIQNEARINRNEVPRYLNSSLFLSGNLSTIDYDGQGKLEQVSGDHIHITGISADYNKNSVDDELRLAFSILNSEITSSANPDSVKVLIEFTSADTTSTSGVWAKMEVDVEDISSTNTGVIKQDFENDRYVVAKVKLNDLHRSTNFSWSAVTAIKISAMVEVSGAATSDFWIALDGLRLENVTENPLYGLTGYTVIKTDNTLPIKKFANTANFLEFRFGLGVQ
jgi:hypothetical protein